MKSITECLTITYDENGIGWKTCTACERTLQATTDNFAVCEWRHARLEPKCHACETAFWAEIEAFRSSRSKRKTKTIDPLTPLPKKAMSVAGTVYVMHYNEIPGLYKIGATRNIKNRMMVYVTGMPFKPVLLMSAPSGDCFGLENQLHRHFLLKRVRREWFALDAGDLAHIGMVFVAEQEATR